VIEVILQHRDTGMFLGEEGRWEDLSRDALVFATAAEALQFADQAEMGRSVCAVIRFRDDKYHILMPLLDRAANAATGQARNRTAH
jgi:hypothetical protein